jgi:hypothetical protein
MSEGRSRESRSLTGVWQGIYDYPRGAGPTTPFTATLIEAGQSLSGSVHEQCLMHGSPNQTLFATLLGARRDSAVSFVKTYDGSNPAYTTVVYDGTLNEEATEIEGRWTVPRNWSGKFLMIRSGEEPAKAEEREGAESSRETAELTPAR